MGITFEAPVVIAFVNKHVVYAPKDWPSCESPYRLSVVLVFTSFSGTA